MNTITKTTVLIKLLNDASKVTMQWQLDSVWPTKITSTGLKSDEKEVAVGKIDFHTLMNITNGAQEERNICLLAIALACYYLLY